MDDNIKNFIKTIVMNWAYCKDNYQTLYTNSEGYQTVASRAKLNELKLKAQHYEYIMLLLLENNLITSDELEKIKKEIEGENK